MTLNRSRKVDAAFDLLRNGSGAIAAEDFLH